MALVSTYTKSKSITCLLIFIHIYIENNDFLSLVLTCTHSAAFVASLSIYHQVSLAAKEKEETQGFLGLLG